MSSRLVRRRAFGVFLGLDLKITQNSWLDFDFLCRNGYELFEKGRVTKYSLGVAFWKVICTIALKPGAFRPGNVSYSL